MKSMKKVWVFILTALLIVSFTIGCGTSNNTAASDSKSSTAASSAAETTVANEAPQTVEVMYVDWQGFKYTSKLKLFEKIEKDCNIILKPSVVIESSFSEKFNTLLASQSLPDVIFHVGSIDTANSLGIKGALLPVSDYLDKMPNVKKLLDRDPDGLKMLLASDGKLYKVPMFKESEVNTQGIAVREDVLKKKGFDVTTIKTVDDLYKAFLLLKEANGGKAPFGTRDAVHLTEFKYFARVFGVYSKDFLGDVQYNNDSGKFEYPIMSENLKDAVVYFAKMYKDGIVSSDITAMNDQQWDAGNKANSLLTFCDNCPNLNSFNPALWASGISDANYMEIMPPSYKGKVYPWKQSSKLFGDFGDVINAKTKSLEGVLKLEDWYYNNDNLDFIIWGIEGETFKKDSDGKQVNLMSGAEGTKTNTEKYGFGCNWNWNRYIGLPGLKYDKSAIVSWADSQTIAVIKQYEDMSGKFYTLPIDPAPKFTKEQLDTLKQIKTPIDTFVLENLMKFIINTKPMSEWDSFVSQFTKMKSADVIKIYNDSLGSK